jgi:hypothetical protein
MVSHHLAHVKSGRKVCPAESQIGLFLSLDYLQVGFNDPVIEFKDGQIYSLQ